MTNSLLIKRLIIFWELIKILQNAKIKKKEKVNSHSNTLYKKLIRQRYIIQNFIKVFIIIYVSLSAHFLLKII